MNKKVQHKKSIFVAGVLSLSAFAMLGLGAMSLSPSKIYAEAPVVVTGTTVLTAMKTAAGITAEPGTADYETQHPNITSITFTNSQPGAGYENKTTEVSFDYDNWQIWYDSTNKAISIYKDTTTNGKFSFPVDSSCMFKDLRSLATIDFGTQLIDTSNVTSMNYMFGCNYNYQGWTQSPLTSLDLSDFDTTNVTDMESMFRCCKLLTSLDFSSFNTANVTTLAYFLHGCNGLTSITWGDNFDTSNVTTMEYTFSSCSSMQTIDISDWDTSNVTTMFGMFKTCYNLTSVTFGSNWDTSKVTNMSNMFVSDYALTTLDVSDWDTSNVTNMNAMFNKCFSLTMLDVSDWDTSKVTNFASMFYFESMTDPSDPTKTLTSSLTTLDVSNWNTSSATSMSCMFYYCEKLTELDVSGWDTSKVTDMNHMFTGNKTLTALDVSGWDTSKVTDTRFIFSVCPEIEMLDLSNWDTSKVTDMRQMFSYDTKLTTIYASDKFVTTALTTGNDANLFGGDSALKGGEGTTYSSTNIDATYARIDQGPTSSAPGYFTEYALQFSTTIDGSASVSGAKHSGNVVYYNKDDATHTVTVKYNIAKNAGMGALQFNLDYDTTAFTFQSLSTTGTVLTGATVTGTEISATEHGFVWNADDAATSTATGLMVTATFTVNAGISEATAYTFGIKDVVSAKAKTGSEQTLSPEFILNNNAKDEYVKRAASTTSITTFSSTYDAAAITGGLADTDDVQYTTTGDGAVTFEDVTDTATTTLPTNAGTYSIKATVADGYLYYGSTDTQTFTINKATLTLTPSATIAYSSEASAAAYTITATGLQGSDTFDDTTYATSTYLKLSSDYTTSTPASETPYADYVLWLSTAEDAIEGVYTNYDAVLETGDLTVNSAKISLSGITFNGLTTTYNTADQSLSLSSTVDNTSTVYQKIKTTEGTAFSGSDVTVVKYVADSGYYIAVITPNTNYVLDTTTFGDNWTGDATSATFKATDGTLVTVSKATLATPSLTYNKDTMSWTAITQDTNGVTVDVTVSYTVDGTSQSTTSYTATAEATSHTVIAVPSSTDNYDSSAEATSSAVYAVSFAEGTWDADIARDATVQGMPSTEYYFANQTFVVPTDPTLKNYNFSKWTDSNSTQYTDATSITATVQLTANWTAKYKVTVTFKLALDGVDEAITLTTLVFYQDDTTADIEKLMNDNITMPSHVWFVTNDKTTWYDSISFSPALENTYEGFGGLTTKDTTKLAKGYQNFEIGLGDIDGNKLINTDDLSIYRQYIVGGYDLNTIEKNDEINKDRVKKTDSEEYKSDFLKRVADVNINGTSIVGDGKYDVRDVCTIAMAIAGGYNLTKDIPNQYGNPQISMETSLNKTNFINFMDTYTDATKIVFATDNTIPQGVTLSYLTLGQTNDAIVGYYDEATTTLYVKNVNENGKIYAPVSCDRLFAGRTNLTSIDFSNFDTSRVTNMQCMFFNCKNLTSLDVTGFDTRNVTTMASMFQNIFNTVEQDPTTTINISNFDTSKVTTFERMFCGASTLTTLNLTNFDTSNATSMRSMFRGCRSLATLDITSFDTSKVTNMFEMFFGTNLTSLDLSHFDTSNVTNMASMFQQSYNLSTLNLTSFNTINVTTMSKMFETCYALTTLDLSNFDTSNVSNMSNMFYRCTSLTTVNLSSFNTSNVTSTSYMFAHDTLLTTIYASDTFVTEQVTTDGSMFYNNTALVGGNGTSFATAKVKNKSYARIDTAETPGYFTAGATLSKTALTEALASHTDAKGVVFATNSTVIPTEALANATNLGTGVNASKVIGYYDDTNDVLYIQNTTGKILAPADCSNMFNAVITPSYEKMTSIDCSGLDTACVTNMSGMFKNSKNGLLNTLNVSTLNTANVTDMTEMFRGCIKVTTIDVSNFNTAKVTSMNNMFRGCYLVTELDVSHFVTTQVTDMSHMFQNCTEITTLNLSSFNTSNVTDMTSMFAQCAKLATIDVSTFNTANVTAMGEMFYKCYVLTTIYASSTFTIGQDTTSNAMFSASTNLKGMRMDDQTPVYFDFVSSKVDATYAKIFTDTQDGYFTDVSLKPAN